MIRCALISCAYIAAFVAANLSIARFGPQSAPLTAFLLVGGTLVLRDLAHDRWQGRGLWVKMTALVVASGAVSYLLNPAAGRIAVASFLAILGSGLVEATVYQINIRRRWVVRSNISNVFGAVADSCIFALVAFGPLWGVIGMMTLAKVCGGAVWTWFFGKRQP